MIENDQNSTKCINNNSKRCKLIFVNHEIYNKETGKNYNSIKFFNTIFL